MSGTITTLDALNLWQRVISSALRELVNRRKFRETRDLAINKRRFHGTEIPLTVCPPLVVHASANHCMKNW